MEAMTQKRHGHTATLLPSGRVLVAGGSPGNTVSDPSIAELYDPVVGSWRMTGAMSASRSGHTATLLPSGQVLVLGGGVDAVEHYEPTTGAWRITGAMTTARSAHTATLLPSGKLLVAGGGASGAVRHSTAELYDPELGSWTPTGSMATARAGHTATLLPSGQVLVVGGDNTGSAELYDPATSTWSATGSPLVHHDGPHTATLLPSGQVLVAGGGPDVAELYDPATGTWSATGAMAHGRVGHTATLLPSGLVLVAGGGTDVAELYDPVTGSWRTTLAMAKNRYSHTATLLPSREVLVTGGFTSYEWTEYLGTAESYQPAPKARAVSTATAEDQPLRVVLEAEDMEGDVLTHSVRQAPAHGTLSGTAPALIYTPHLDFHGEDSFTFQAHDGRLASEPTAVSLRVTPVNDAPRAHPASLTTSEDTAISMTLEASDVDGDALTYVVVKGPEHGSLLGTGPDFTFVPHPGYGVDSFTYKVSDGALDSEVVTVSLTVFQRSGCGGCGSASGGGAGAWAAALVLLALGLGRRPTV
jgi:hypothetical protein